MWLSGVWPEWRSALSMVKPETVIEWHRQGFRLFWTWKVRQGVGRPKVPVEVRKLIREISIANPLWGAPPIHGELLKLGIDVSESSVSKYMRRERKPPSRTWRTFLDLLRDRDAIFSRGFSAAVQKMGAEEVLSAPRSPWQRAYIERVIGTIRRECLDHVIVWNEASLRRHVQSFVAYYHAARTHLSLGKDSPDTRAVQRQGKTVAIREVGGLHHRYERRAA